MAGLAVWSLLLAALSTAGSAAAPGLDLRVPMRSEEGRRLQAAGLQDAASPYGATLDAVHAHRLEEDALVHVRHSVEQPPADSPARQLVGATKRDMVRMLMRMNAASYSVKGPYGEDILGPIVAAGDSLYGADVDTYAKEVAKETAHMEKILKEFAGTYSAQTGGTYIDASGLDSIGVHALEFTVPGVGKVLLFRGSVSEGDYDNMKMWITDWIVTKLSAKMKYAWLTIAKLPWSKELEQDRNPVSGFFSQQVLYVGSWWYGSNFMKKMTELAKGTGGLVDPDKVAKTGYWEFTKLIADSVRRNLAREEHLILTGHSQGGTRAALVSMYFEKKYNEKRQAVTFAAVGGQCFSREFSFTDGSLTDDVDPYVSHSQIVEYVHPLDVYGMFDYDVGIRCVYGMTGIAQSQAKKYCEKIFGHTGPDLLAAGKIGSIGADIDAEFKRCRYFTHSSQAMTRDLMNDTYVEEDGTTDGGCAAMQGIPKDDPEKKCKNSGWFDGCSDELSCEACQVSSSASNIFSCYWCESSGKCVSGSAWYVKCADEFIGPKDTCPAAQVSAAHGAGARSLIPPLVACLLLLLLLGCS